MSRGVEFYENNEFHQRTRKPYGKRNSSAIIRILLRTGLAKTRKQAEVVLLFLASGLLILATYFLYPIFYTPKIDYVVAPDGTQIEVEEYIRMLGRGENPLDNE